MDYMARTADIIEGFKETEIGLLPEDWDAKKLSQLFDIQHELLHMKYPNHGKMFKALLRSYLK